MLYIKMLGGFLLGLGMSGTARDLMKLLPEIATVGIVLCAFGLMITANIKIWIGRIFMIFWISVSILMVR